MLGRHLTEQPLYVTLVRYRVVAVISLAFIGYMMLNAWNFYEIHYAKLSAESAAAFFTYIAILLGAFVKCVNNIQERHEK